MVNWELVSRNPFVSLSFINIHWNELFVVGFFPHHSQFSNSLIPVQNLNSILTLCTWSQSVRSYKLKGSVLQDCAHCRHQLQVLGHLYFFPTLQKILGFPWSLLRFGNLLDDSQNLGRALYLCLQAYYKECNSESAKWRGCIGQVWGASLPSLYLSEFTHSEVLWTLLLRGFWEGSVT